MRFKYLLTTILFFIAIICTTQAIAQMPTVEQLQAVKVDQLSDGQITTVWQRLKGTGLADSEIYSQLLKRGMPGVQIQALKDRVTLLGLNGKKSGANSETSSSINKSTIDYTRRQNDTVILPNNRRNNTLPAASQSTYRTGEGVLSTDKLTEPPPQGASTIDDALTSFPVKSQKLEVYGLDLFKQKEFTFEPNFSVTTPKSYILGTGDEVIVLLTGLNEVSVTNKVSPEGNLQIPHAEIIHVSGFTIEQATQMVTSKMAKIYPALRTGQTKLSLTLGNPRSIKVTVIGEANIPGTFTISALASPFNLLYHAGGPNENGSLRTIQLIRNNKLYKTLDFYSFLQNGLSENIRIEDQDVLNIPVYKKRIGIKGEIKRPALYELTAGETLADLIKYAGGFTPQAYQAIAKIDQINDLQRQIKDVPSTMFASYLPNSGDVVQIQEVSNRYTNRIVLEGAVYQPGTYELTAGFTLKDLLSKAQGLKPEAYSERGIINRTLPDLEKTAIPFNPIEVLSGKNDIPLMREDMVVIFERSAFISEQVVTVEGYVHKPITITYRKGLKLADAIAQAGGLDVEGAPHRIEISRIIKNQSDVVATQLVNTFVVDLSDSTKANGELELQALDIVFVRRLVNYRPLGNIAIAGEVVFPGDYSVQKRDETALEFLARAGGLTPYGSLENVQVFRESTRVNVDLTNKNPRITNKMILLPGDSVYVPRNISYVEVAGAVNNPQYITYKNRRFKYYIDAAAGLTEDARIKGAYISYPNGLNQPVKNVLFFRTYPTVTPGSKIFVPEKNPNGRAKVTIAEFGALATALTAIVSLIAILSR